MQFTGKTALITGAGRGIGRAIAEAFAREGANVAACDMDRILLNELAEALGKFDVKHHEYACDVSDAGQVQRTVEQALEALGNIDILVNNAGVSYVVPFLEMDDRTWDKTIAVNLRGTYLFCKAVLPHMVEKQRGKIINMSSQSGKKGNTHYAAYCASKFGIIGLTQSLAVEFAEYGIHINAVCPGVVFTPLWETMIPDYARKKGIQPAEVKQYLESKIPLKRLATVGDVANVVLFLASDAANYLTGQSINVTGGAIMH